MKLNLSYRTVSNRTVQIKLFQFSFSIVSNCSVCFWFCMVQYSNLV